MNPWLHVGGFALPTYFTCLMVGFALATFVLRREALRDAAPARPTLDAALWVLPGALVGARALHVALNGRYYLDHPLDALTPSGGWVFYGGVLGGSAALLAFARVRDLDPWAVFDRFAVASAFGLVFGRLGCLGGGCCFGRVADWPTGVAVPWSVLYLRRGQLPDALLGVPLHPTPLYEIGLALALFVGLSWWRRRGARPGDAILAFLLVYGVGRSVIEVFRADVARGLFLHGWLSTSQGIGLCTATAAGVVAWRRR